MVKTMTITCTCLKAGKHLFLAGRGSVLSPPSLLNTPSVQHIAQPTGRVSACPRIYFPDLHYWQRRSDSILTITKAAGYRARAHVCGLGVSTGDEMPDDSAWSWLLSRAEDKRAAADSKGDCTYPTKAVPWARHSSRY